MVVYFQDVQGPVDRYYSTHERVLCHSRAGLNLFW